MQGYGWLKDRILGEEGRRQQMQLRELGLIAEQLGCSLAQLAIGHTFIFTYSVRGQMLTGQMLTPLSKNADKCSQNVILAREI